MHPTYVQVIVTDLCIQPMFMWSLTNLYIQPVCKWSVTNLCIQPMFKWSLSYLCIFKSLELKLDLYELKSTAAKTNDGLFWDKCSGCNPLMFYPFLFLVLEGLWCYVQGNLPNICDFFNEIDRHESGVAPRSKAVCWHFERKYFILQLVPSKRNRKKRSSLY